MKKILYSLLGIILISSMLITGCKAKTSSAPSGSEVLNLAGSDPTTLDPAVASEANSDQYIREIFSGLLKLNEKMQPVGDIAQSWDVSSDGLTYTFHLRHDVKFQNGRQLTAQDVKYSWERAANPATHSQTVDSYLGDISGIKEELAGTADHISGLKALDDYTLQVTLSSPESYFLDDLTFPSTFIVDRNNVDSGANWWQKPNGTGPFKLGQWTKGQSLTLERNNLYYGTLPHLSQVNYQYYTGLPMDLFETGKIDATEVSTNYFDEVTDKSGPFYKDLTVSPSLELFYIGFNCSKPPFDDVNIRKAFSMAIDKDKIISLVFKNMEQKADGILPPGMPGYNPNLVGLGYNVTKAKELIKASKYGGVSNLPPITLTTYGYGGSVGDDLQSLVHQWKQNLGVDVKIRQLEPDRYFYNTKAEIDQMFDTDWIADYPNPQDFLDILFSSGSDGNFGSYSNPKVDALIKQANQTSNQEQSFTLYQQAEQLIVNDAACIPIFFGKTYTLVQPYVKGYTINPLGYANLDQVSIIPH